MTKLEELKAARDAAWDAYDAWDAKAAWDAAYDAYYTADAAYRAELEKTQKENTND
tara:strand:+ start:334 stop:501 length:168 start_codon:yes stop_codon:yes gene_type:complete